ncbi:gluconate 2-dehydrogenase subunit 3 family protein [Robiginitomaculum antarcticum]|uniref:gluconate 2-dehydrogenase subunit 3 family protein n=1 Tax=Robiginitomaculum antarcticum TaxID=437507 RepID=UPI00036C12C5|nr:gluconate 2-dehydrogenase subunit 3 family protein [Robiginitomaculum antarcticum]
MYRRDMMKALLAVSAGGALAACGQKTAPEASAITGAEFDAAGRFFTTREMAIVGALANTIIPDTDTPGAVAAGVPAVIQDLASNWATPEIRAGWRAVINGLNDSLGNGERGFAELGVDAQAEALSAFDSVAYSGEASELHSGYRDVKSTIATAYYMSEIGATQELRYEAVPGEWKGCIPFSEVGKTWAT